MQGDPRDEATDMSCLISRPTSRRWTASSGARSRGRSSTDPRAADRTPSSATSTTRPTILVDAEPGSEILTEEVFGPVLTIQTFSGEEQAIEMANSTRFGLAATLVTGDPDRAERVSARLNAGTVWVNCFFVRDLGAPFGGNGQSGIGREGGIYSFDFYTDVKNTVFAPNGWTTNG